MNAAFVTISCRKRIIKKSITYDERTTIINCWCEKKWFRIEKKNVFYLNNKIRTDLISHGVLLPGITTIRQFITTTDGCLLTTWVFFNTLFSNFHPTPISVVIWSISGHSLGLFPVGLPQLDRLKIYWFRSPNHTSKPLDSLCYNTCDHRYAQHHPDFIGFST